MKINGSTVLKCYDILGGMNMAHFRFLHWKGNPPNHMNVKFVKDANDLVRPYNGTQIGTEYHYTSSIEINNKKYHGVLLSLQNLTSSDGGWYSCVACNHVGCSIESGYIKIVEAKGKNVALFVRETFDCWPFNESVPFEVKEHSQKSV